MYSGEKSIDSILQEGYEVKIEAYLQRGWEILKQNLGGFIGFTIVQVLIGIIIALMPERLEVLLTPIFNFAISPVLAAGFSVVAFKIIKGHSTGFGDFFLGFNSFLPIFLVNLLVSLFILLGLFALIIPGIFLAVAYSFSFLFVIGRKFDFWEAMESSRKVISRRWFSFFAFFFVLGLVNLVGLLLLGVGLLVTIPLSSCAMAAAFDDIVGLPASDGAVI